MRRKDREVSDRAGLEAILEGCDVCHLAFADGDFPYIVTMNFGWEWTAELPLLFFHGARAGRKLEMMRKKPRVCFEMDMGHVLIEGPSPCDWGMKYSSLVGYGTLSELESPTLRTAALERIMLHYGWQGQGGYEAMLAATAVLSLRVDEMSGKRKSD